MGNQRFKLSDMIPNAWFYKLKYMNNSPSSTATNRRAPGSRDVSHGSNSRQLPNKKTNPNSPPTSTNPSYPKLLYSSYSIPVSLDPPTTYSRRSRRKPPRRRTVYRPSSLPRRHCSGSTSSSEVEPDSSDEDLSSNHNIGGFSAATDIVLDMYAASIPKLPPILTKPSKLDANKEQRAVKLQSKRIAPSGGRRSGSRSCVVSFRNKKIENDSVAMAKLSVDPIGDFRVSMEEMITEYNIKDSADLEDLLACYLSLNSSYFHDQIVRAFEQIWFGVISRRRIDDD